MNKLIIVTGSLATGKSTYSKILANKFHIALYNKDTIKESLSDVFGFKNRDDNLKLSKATFDIMMYIFNNFSISNNDLILEANFHNDEVKMINELSVKLNYDVLYLVLDADDEVLYKRFCNRAKNENRHPCHLSGFDDFDSFKEYINKSRYVEYNNYGQSNIDLCLVIQNDFSYQKNKELLSRIKQFLNK